MRAFNNKAQVRILFALEYQFDPYSIQFFVCGSNKVAKAVKSRFVEILRSLRPGLDEVTAAAELEILLKGRFATDVFD